MNTNYNSSFCRLLHPRLQLCLFNSTVWTLITFYKHVITVYHVRCCLMFCMC